MDPTSLRACLAGDYRRLHELVSRSDLDARVPSCPDWTVADLARHTATVYMHKVACTKLGKPPEDWPPDLSTTEPAIALDRAYSDLNEMFASHDPSDHSHTWYDDDQTVGFWIRRMAQETVIHRRDAELVANDPTPADSDLAINGIAELLDLFVSWPTRKWAADCKDELEPADGDTFLIDADGTRWFGEIGLGGVVVTHPDAPKDAMVGIQGSPSAVLFWLWNRWAPSDGAVTVEGDQAAVDRLRNILTLSTQ